MSKITTGNIRYMYYEIEKMGLIKIVENLKEFKALESEVKKLEETIDIVEFSEQVYGKIY